MSSPTVTNQLIVNKGKRDIAFFEPQNRHTFFDNFLQRPVVVGTLEPGTVNTAAVRALVAANKDWLLTGTSGIADGDCTFAANGGITLATKASSSTNNDTTNIRPGVVTGPIEFSGLYGTQFRPDMQPHFDAVIETPATITGYRLILGFRLAASFPDTAADETTGADVCFFAFSTGSSVTATKWRRVTIVASGTPADVALNTPVLVASTRYRMRIEIDSGRRPHFYQQVLGPSAAPEVLVGVGPALTAAAAFQPFVTVQRLASAAKTLTVHSLRASRLLG